MTEISISIPARNAQGGIDATIRSLLIQDDVDFELIVVDDGSTDDTASIVARHDDPKITLIKNSTQRGIGYCHNLVIEKSRSPYLAHVAPGDIISFGALRKMLDKISSNPKIGLAYCHGFDIDAQGRITREAFRKERQHAATSKSPGLDHRMALLVHGMAAGRLCTYRREIFDVVGKFDETIPFDNGEEMAFRIADHFDIALVPKFLYGRRREKEKASMFQALAPLKSWIRRCRLEYRIKKKGQVKFVHWPPYNRKRLMLTRFADGLKIPEKCRTLKHRMLSCLTPQTIVQKKLRPVFERLYYLAVAHLSWWPVWYLSRRKAGRSHGGRHRVGYYLWRFPILSETFIRREITALKKTGICVHVFSDAAVDLEYADEYVFGLRPVTHYLLPLNPQRLAAYRRHFFREKPFVYLCLMLCVILSRYDYWKTFTEDREIFHIALYLAGMMKENGINQVHAPWADRAAFIVLLASRLLGVPYTVQARAHELYHIRHLYALRAKFRSAALIITNSRYNERRISQLVKNRVALPIHVIYEGVDLAKLDSQRESWDIGDTVKILCVGRLVEQKGLTYLLHACKRLSQDGRKYVCDIIGGPHEPSYTTYLLNLKKLFKKLKLNSRVRFRGAQPFNQVLQSYREADIFVLPCVVDSFGGRDMTPNVLFEAMAMALPVVSTKLSAIPEIVEDGVSGLLVPPKDSPALYEAMSKLIDNEDLRRTLGQNARKRIAETFNLNQNIKQFTTLWTRLRQ